MFGLKNNLLNFQINTIILYKFIQLLMMYRRAMYSNKHIKRRQQERLMDYHKHHLSHMRPMTGTIEKDDGVVLNNRKGEMQKETRFTEIERQNRILLEKISSIMSKTKSKLPLNNNPKYNKSLNSSFRRRQHQNIEIENAKLLKRLQQKKPNYDTEKLKQQWKKQKTVIKNLSNYPFIINDQKKKTHGKRSISINGGTGNHSIELCRVRVIDGTSFLITVKMTPAKLQIIGDCKDKKEVKVIEIEKGEAIDFLEHECKGKIEQIFDCLRYDKKDEVLYLVGADTELEEIDKNKKDFFDQCNFQNKERKKQFEKDFETRQQEQFSKQQKRSQEILGKKNEQTPQKVQNSIKSMQQIEKLEKQQQLGVKEQEQEKKHQKHDFVIEDDEKSQQKEVFSQKQIEQKKEEQNEKIKLKEQVIQ